MVTLRLAERKSSLAPQNTLDPLSPHPQKTLNALVAADSQSPNNQQNHQANKLGKRRSLNPSPDQPGTDVETVELS